MSEKRVDIVDSKNPLRVLGSVPRPDMQGSCYRMAVWKPMKPLWSYDLNTDAATLTNDSVRTVTFFTTPVWDDDGWSGRRVLTTSDRLEDLRYIRGFRYPGEGARQASERHYRQGW